MEHCHSIRNKVQLFGLKVGLLSCFFKEKIFRSGIGNLCGRGKGDERVDSARRQSFRFIVYIEKREKSRKHLVMRYFYGNVRDICRPINKLAPSKKTVFYR